MLYLYYTMKLLSKKDDKKTEREKVDERREEVLARGRKFKYPLQFTKYRIVVNTVLISVIVIAMLVFSGWLALYQFGMTSEMLFRVTKIIPVPAASIDGEKVLFSDYLMFYRSSITSIERQSGEVDLSGSFDELRLQYKRAALDEAEKYTYAAKLAKEMDITVTDEEVANELARHLAIGGVNRSEEGFIKIINENFGLTKEEYEQEYGAKPLGELGREIVGLDMNAAKAAFSEYLESNDLDSRQIYFVNQIVEYIVHNGMMKDLSVLQESPFTDQGSVVEIFTDLNVWMGIRKVIDSINDNARVA